MTRNTFFLLQAIAIVFFLSSNSHAQNAQDFFKIHKIAVDVIAVDARTAQAQALEQGHRRAFTVLLRRLTMKEYHSHLPILSTAEITPMVSGFQVAHEKTSATRYIADLTFDFKPEGIRKLLRNRNIPYGETASKPILILPVYSQAGESVLWEEPNPWREIWTQVVDGDLQEGASIQQKDDWGQTQPLPTVVPTGDLSDIRLINVDQALAADIDAMEAMAEHYGAGDVLVVHASIGPGSTDQQIRLDVTSLRYSDDGVTSVIDSFTGAFDPEKGGRAFLQQTITTLSEKLQNDWKRNNVIQHDSVGLLSVIVPIESLKMWLQIHEQVRNIASVREIRIRELSIKAAAIEIMHLGEIDQLRLALAQKDLILSSRDGYWTLERRK